MAKTLQSRTFSIPIDCQLAKAYEFVSDPANLPKWAKAFCKSVKKSGDDWIMETPQGPMKVRFAKKNALGVLDHYVNPTPEIEVFVPMRVLPNGSGSEVIFTLFRLPEMSDEKFAEDIGMVERDLQTLKNVLEVDFLTSPRNTTKCVNGRKGSIPKAPDTFLYTAGRRRDFSWFEAAGKQ
jgi:hypothetical protein